MAISIISPQFSFVKFKKSYSMDEANNWEHTLAPGKYIDWPLPIQDVGDLRYMFKIIAPTLDDQVAICDWVGSTTGFSLSVIPGIHTAVAGFGYPVTQNLQATWVRISETEWIVFVEQPLPGTFEANIAIGDCFQLRLAYAGTEFWISNPFMRVADDGYTTSFLYRCENDQYGFWYCHYPHASGMFYNKVRLPMFFGHPGYLEDKAVYNKANGQQRVRKNTITGTWQVKSDMMPKWAHDCTLIALGHEDFISESIAHWDSVKNAWQPYKVKKEGEYKPDYEDYIGFPMATVDFKVLEEYFLGNVGKYDNCNICADISRFAPMLTQTEETLNYSKCEPFVLGLDPYVQGCSGPTTYSVLYFNSARVATHTMFPNGNLQFTIGSGSGWVGGLTVVLFVILISAPGLPATPFTVYGTFTGSSLC